MQIQEVVLKGFKSFAEETHWHLPERPGLYMIAGNNTIAPQLHSNGAGTSTLIEAIPWAFYGKTSRGLRGGEIASWNGPRSAMVEVRYARNNQTHVIQRGTQPGSLILDGSDIDQDQANSAIGLNFDCFSFAAMVGQFARHFIDLAPAEKLALFSFVLGLDYWQDCAARAKDAANIATEKAGEANNRQAQVKGRYEEVADRLASLDAIITRSRRQLEEDRSRLEGEVAQYEADIAAMRRDAAWMRRKVHIAQRAVDEATAAKRAAQAGVEEHVGKQAAAAAKANAQKMEIARLTGEVDKLKRAFPRCVECGQEVSRDHYNSELAIRQERVAAARTKRTELDEEAARCSRSLSDVRSEVATHERTVSTLLRSKQDMESKVRRTDANREQAEGDLRHVQADIRRLEETASSNGERTLEYEETLENMRFLGESLRDCLFDLRVAKRRERFMDFWATRGFKNLRLSIMEDALRQLETHVNSDVATLGLDGWNVEFVVERKTKAGTLSHGMQTMISPPGAEIASKWETYCGGEVQRLRIATTVGMMKLVSDYFGVVCDIEMWDEPTAHLNPQGVSDLLEFLRTRARVENKRIFIVDHRSLDSGLFDGVLTVTRDESGSHLGPWL